ncbi:MAG TPA: hypothetical protein VGW10_13195, partial [Solirubrobacteraceae bacterium]|nr:hypothetical protein [Solirubrobacteraceae bacterium]
MSYVTARSAFAALVVALVALALPAAAPARPWAPATTITSFTGSDAMASWARTAVLPNGDSVVVYFERTEDGTRTASRRRAAGSATWDAPRTLATPSVYPPNLAVEPGGALTAVWQVGTGHVMTSTLSSPTGEWSTPAVAYAPADVFPYPPFIHGFAIAPDGRAAFLIHVADGEHSIPELRVVTRTGGTWSGPTTVASGRNLTGIASFAMNAGGAMVAAWQWSTGSGSSVVQAATGSIGGAWGEAVTVGGTGQDRYPVAAMGADGRATVAWDQVRASSSTSVLRAASRPAGGAWSEPTDVVAPGTDHYASKARLAADAEGDLVLVYELYRAAAGSPNTWRGIGAVEKPATGEWGTPRVISTGTDNQNAVLSLDPGGAAVIAWRNFDSGTKVVLGHRLADGTWSSPEIVASYPSSAPPTEPDVAFRAGAEAVVAWGRKPSADTGVAEASSGRPSPPDTSAPQTTIDSGTSGTAAGSTASFTFSARDENGALEVDPTFECRLDRGPRTGEWEPCSSPKEYAKLGPAPYTFRVRATDASSNVDASPATRSFTLQPLGGAPGTSAGSLDGTFGHAGRIYDWGARAANKVLPVGDGKLVVASNAASLTRFAADGSFDTSFGDEGQALASFGSGQWETTAVNDAALAPDGKIVTLTDYWYGVDRELGIARFTADGQLDASFGGDGRVASRPPGFGLVSHRVLVQSDGRPVVLSQTIMEAQQLNLTRYTTSGDPDTTFGGGDGAVSDRPTRYRCFPRDAALQPDDKIVVVGHCGNQYTPDTDWFVVRYAADGSRDGSFGVGGLVTSQLGNLDAVAVAPDGDVVVAGVAASETGTVGVALERLTPAGTVDAGFGTNGRVVIEGSAEGQAKDMLVDPDGKPVVAGRIDDAAFLARVNADGTPDTSLSPTGLVQHGLGELEADPKTVARLADGKLVAAGRVYVGPGSGPGAERLLLARFNATAPADSTPPDTLIDSGPTGTHTSASGAFAFHATEDGSTFECRLDRPAGAGAWGACTSPKQYSDLAEGAHTFRVRATDAAGNADASEATRSFTVQLEGPPPPEPAVPANDDFANASLLSGSSPTATGNNAGATKQAGEPDHAGNAGGPSVWWKWVAPSSGATTVQTCGAGFDTLLGVYTGTAVNATATVSSDDDACAPASRVQFTATAGTTYFIAVDGYGGAAGSIPLSLTLAAAADTTPPQTTIGSGPAAASRSTSATITFASESNATFACKLDAGAWVAGCTSPRNLSSLGEGSHTFQVRATDAAGNTDPTPASHTWTVDLTPPAATIVSGPAGTTSATSARFELGASEPGATFLCSGDGGASFDPCDAVTTFDGLEDGDYVFQARARDAAGNESPVVEREWTVDSGAAAESHQVAAGGTVVAPPPTSADPVASQIESPNAGTVTVDDSPTSTTAPTGYTLLGTQVAITAPAGSVDTPLRLVFRIDASALPAGVDETNIVVFRNGAAAALCAADDGRAVPTPCVAQRRRLGDGDVEVTVLTVQASTWN